MSDHKRILKTVDRVAVQDSITNLFCALDARDWDRVKLAFAKEVQFDMTSLTGGEPRVMTPADIAGLWADKLAGFAELHHQVSNFVVDLEIYTGTVSCHCSAIHFDPDADKPITEIAGTYDLEVVRSDRRWRISSFRFNQKYAVSR